jgi:hypothetical protein
MKTQILKMTLLVCIATAALTRCNNSPEKKGEDVEKAKENLGKAMKDLNQARLDSVSEYMNYKAESEAKFAENDQKISELREKMKQEKKEIRIKYEKQLEELDGKNAKLKITMREYKEGTKNNWQSFKEMFNRDLDELGKLISSFSEKYARKN